MVFGDGLFAILSCWLHKTGTVLLFWWIVQVSSLISVDATPAPPQVLLLVGLFLALLLSVAHTLYSLYSLQKLSYDDAVPSEMAEDKETGILGGVRTGWSFDFKQSNNVAAKLMHHQKDSLNGLCSQSTYSVVPMQYAGELNPAVSGRAMPCY